MHRWLAIGGLACLLAGSGSAIAQPQSDSPTTKKQAAAEWSEDGLQRVKIQRLAHEAR